MEAKIFGAEESLQDSRTVQHESTMSGEPLIKGGVDYQIHDIENQHKVGICTAISFVQNREKANKKRYSADFQYLLQKKFFDLGWYEGSSIFYALKVGKKFGLLPASDWTYTTEQDRFLPYPEYQAKLQAIPDKEIDRLLTLCVDKIAGYAQVDVSDSQAIAKAISESQAGILTRFNVGKEWYTSVDGKVSYSPADINLLRPPRTIISGHAIVMSSFDYTECLEQILANTWGSDWNIGGTAGVNFDSYKPTEAWTILKEAPAIPKFEFKKDLSFGLTSPDVQQLQIILNSNPETVIADSGAGSISNETQYFGMATLRAVKKFQTINKLPSTGFVGPLTRAILNKSHL